MPNQPREGYRSANSPDDDVEGHGNFPQPRNAPDEEDTEGHGNFPQPRNAPDEEDTEGHGNFPQPRYKPEGYRSAATPEDEDTEGHDFRSPASRGE
jgi:hypothetical protein